MLGSVGPDYYNILILLLMCSSGTIIRQKYSTEYANVMFERGAEGSRLFYMGFFCVCRELDNRHATLLALRIDNHDPRRA